MSQKPCPFCGATEPHERPSHVYPRRTAREVPEDIRAMLAECRAEDLELVRAYLRHLLGHQARSS